MIPENHVEKEKPKNRERLIYIDIDDAQGWDLDNKKYILIEVLDKYRYHNDVFPPLTKEEKLKQILESRNVSDSEVLIFKDDSTSIFIKVGMGRLHNDKLTIKNWIFLENKNDILLAEKILKKQSGKNSHKIQQYTIECRMLTLDNNTKYFTSYLTLDIGKISQYHHKKLNRILDSWSYLNFLAENWKNYILEEIWNQ